MKRILLTLTPFSRFFFCFIFQETAGSNVSHKTDSPCANSQVIPALWFQSLWKLSRNIFFQFEQVTQKRWLNLRKFSTLASSLSRTSSLYGEKLKIVIWHFQSYQNWKVIFIPIPWQKGNPIENTIQHAPATQAR